MDLLADCAAQDWVDSLRSVLMITLMMLAVQASASWVSAFLIRASFKLLLTLCLVRADKKEADGMVYVLQCGGNVAHNGFLGCVWCHRRPGHAHGGCALVIKEDTVGGRIDNVGSSRCGKGCGIGVGSGEGNGVLVVVAPWEDRLVLYYMYFLAYCGVLDTKYVNKFAIWTVY